MSNKMKPLVILASVAALMMISITDRLHHDNTPSTANEWDIPTTTIVNTIEEVEVSDSADTTCQKTSTNFLASRKLTKNVFIIL